MQRVSRQTYYVTISKTHITTMRITYRTFTGTSYMAEVPDFSGLVQDIRQKLGLDNDSKIVIASNGRVFRTPHASLEDVVNQGAPIVVRYELSKAGEEERRSNRKIITVSRNGNSVSSISTIPSLVPSVPAGSLVIQPSVEIEDADSDDHPDIDDDNLMHVPNDNADVERLRDQSGPRNSEQKEENNANSEVPNEEEVAMIASVLAPSDGAWNTFHMLDLPRQYSALTRGFTSNLRLNPIGLLSFVRMMMQNSPDTIRSMMISAADESSGSEDDSGNDSGNEDERNHYIQVAAHANHASRGRSHMGHRAPHSVRAVPSRSAPGSRNAGASSRAPRSLSPAEVTTVDLIVDMMAGNVTQPQAESAFRRANFDMNIAVDMLMDEGE